MWGDKGWSDEWSHEKHAWLGLLGVWVVVVVVGDRWSWEEGRGKGGGRGSPTSL